MCPDTSRTQATICAFPNCTSKVWQDPDNSFSSYCGQTHRDAAALLADDDSICKHCKQRPVYIENGRQHDYCGRRCASDAKNATNTSSSRSSVRSPASPQSGISMECCIPGCTRPVFLGADGSISQWCSQSHRAIAVRNSSTETCLYCNKQPKALLKSGMSDYCSRTCAQKSLSLAPAVLPINNNYAEFKEVTKQFIDQWKHRTRVPNVLKVWRIIGLKTLHDDFSRYKLSVERNRNLPGGNSKRRWHGTVRTCQIGDDNTQRGLCTDQNCSLCRIIESSFRLAEYGKRTNYGRFGEGIYTSATSSKANDYVYQRGMSPYKAMLLNDVVLGNAKKLYTDDPTLKQPPTGFDSVIGEPGQILNYDEAIVYKNEAIRPLFLIIYQ